MDRGHSDSKRPESPNKKDNDDFSTTCSYIYKKVNLKTNRSDSHSYEQVIMF